MINSYESLVNIIIDDALEDYCPQCSSNNIANEDPPSDCTLELTCHDCSNQWSIPFLPN